MCVFVFVCVCARVCVCCEDAWHAVFGGASGERNIWRATDRKRDARDGGMARALNNADLFPECPDKTN